MSIKKAGYRIRQAVFCFAQNAIKWRMPKTLSGENSILELPDLIKNEGIKKVLVITTAGFIKRGSLNGMLDKLDSLEIKYDIFSDVKPDPTIDCIEKAKDKYIKGGCEAIIAVGGGSVMDCSKMAAARVAKPEQSIKEMEGFMKIRKKLPLLFAVPTTAGTGSETTVAAVVTDGETHTKYPISDLCLMPYYAVLDPVITCGLPKTLTADTGMDALTHAVEAYTNKFAPKESRKYAKDAVKMIFANLEKAYDNGSDISARSNMLMASFYAGAAFTKAYVGYVHAIAHAVGGLYGVAHGRANAVILPVVLEAYGEAVHKDLSELADAVGIDGGSEREKAEKFIEAIRKMNSYMNIPDKLNVLKTEDIDEILRRVLREGNPSYPVPVIWEADDFKNVLEKL